MQLKHLNQSIHQTKINIVTKYIILNHSIFVICRVYEACLHKVGTFLQRFNSISFKLCPIYPLCVNIRCICHRSCSQEYDWHLSSLYITTSLGLISFTVPQSQKTYSTLSIANFQFQSLSQKPWIASGHRLWVPLYWRCWKWVGLHKEWLLKLKSRLTLFEVP